MEKIDVDELVQAAREGNRKAFGELIERYRGMVYGICYRMSGSRVDAEDLAHDAFVDAFLKLGQLEMPERFGGWLRTLTLNVCRMWLRRRGSELCGEVDELGAVPEEGDEGVRAEIVRALPELTADQRLVLVLHYWEEMSYQEVAEFLEVPVGTVMSRLHRARQALRESIERGECEEGSIMTPDEEFRRTIDAEIDVLLQMFPERAESATRMREIMEQDPGSFVRLVEEMDGEMARPLALLLKYLDGPAISVVLDCHFEADDSRLRVNTLTLLRELLAVGREPDRPGGKFDRHYPEAREVYLVADRLIAGPWERQAKVGLIGELLDAGRGEQPKVAADESGGNLLINLLLCYPDEAFATLMERFWSAADWQELLDRSWILYALRRTGPRFGRDLLDGLSGESERARKRALAGLDVLFPWPTGDWFDQITDDMQRRLEIRFRGKFVPLAVSQMEADAGLREELGTRLAAFLDRLEGDERARVVELLGGLGLPAHVELIRAMADHEELSVRLAALRALNNMLDAGSAELFAKRAREGEVPEKRIAVEALGRLRAVEVVPLLVKLTETAERPVRESAIIALGEVGGEEARSALQKLLGARDRGLVKAAASALYGGGRKNKFGKEEEAEPDTGPSLGQRRMRKVRGDAQPFFYHNIPAAVCALPEIKSYTERELTYHIAQVDYDYSYTRRYLIVRGIMTRENSIYEFTPLGKAMWRVEKFIEENYLSRGESA